MKIETGGEKLITLFNLEGKPIYLRENVPVHYVSNDYAHIHFTDDEEICCVYVGIGIMASEIVRDENLLIPLVKFLNNQLTLIRKGEETGNWDDLDIYQTTMGKHWDVPWYEGVTNGSEDFVENARKEKFNDKFYSFYKPTIDYFLKNYDSKFKDLPIIKGVTNEN